MYSELSVCTDDSSMMHGYIDIRTMKGSAYKGFSLLADQQLCVFDAGDTLEVLQAVVHSM